MQSEFGTSHSKAIADWQIAGEEFDETVDRSAFTMSDDPRNSSLISIENAAKQATISFESDKSTSRGTPSAKAFTNSINRGDKGAPPYRDLRVPYAQAPPSR